MPTSTNAALPVPPPTPCSAWIAVADKMPPIGADVLTWGKSMHKECPDVQRVYNDGNWKPIFQYGWNKGETFEVTHWAKISPPNA